MKKITLLLIFSFVAVAIFGQNRNLYNIIASADKAYKEKNYYGAARLYEEALDINKRMTDIIWSAAEAYRLDNDYVNAARHYRYLSDKHADKFPLSTYYYALMTKSNEDFTRAQYFFQQFIKSQGGDTANVYVRKATEELRNCETAWQMFSKPDGIEILQCDSNINTVFSDFSTAFWGDSTMLFASISPTSDTVTDYKSRLYKVNFFDSASIALPDETFVYPDFDVANPHFNNAGDKLYFTISNGYNGGCSYIYESKLVNGQWTEPTKLCDKINVEGYNSTHPFLVEREGKSDILLWSSDRPGSEGGYDLYQCEIMPDGSFGYPRNISRPLIDDYTFAAFIDTSSFINTAGNEITPFYNVNDSCLYFSSDWHNTIGGYDIFKVHGDFTAWDKNIVNVGYPLNSAQNDFYYKIYPDKYVALFASNRKTAFNVEHQSCCNDIYYHTLAKKEPPPEVVEQQRVTTLAERTRLLVPIALFFHNDCPNPRCMDTVTNLSYETTYFDFLLLQNEYRKKFSQGLPKDERLAAIDSIDDFFSYMVQDNYNKLLEFTNLMKELLTAGQKIEITIKGYTSPLNTVEYNNNLAKRRISSLENYFYNYDGGFFRSYILSGQIVYNFVAFGKIFSAGKVSDDRRDQRNSVYSPAASYERRIEIIAVSVEKSEVIN